MSLVRDLLYPPACVLCHGPTDPTRPVCQPCVKALPTVRAPWCRRCGRGLRGAWDAHVVCSRCQARPPRFTAACAPWSYRGRTRDLVQRFKYGGRTTLGEWIAGHMALSARRALPLEDLEVVVPVPLHWVAARWRDPVAPAVLAREVAAILRRPCDPSLLRRVRWTRSQTRCRSVTARRRNVRGAFRADAAVRGRRVLLVDDVLTSGATADASAEALLAAGARAVYVLAAAVTPRPASPGSSA